jgi:hypothetical protein
MNDFRTMDLMQLKTHVLKHREDKAAWGEYIHRLISQEPKWYPAPLDAQGVEVMEQAFRERFGSPETSE